MVIFRRPILSIYALIIFYFIFLVSFYLQAQAVRIPTRILDTLDALGKGLVSACQHNVFVCK